MRVPLNDSRRELDDEVLAALESVARSGWYIEGEQCRGFVSEFAAYCGVAHCIGTGNGTDALELALRAVGCGPGDEVAMVANAGMYAAAAAVATGATPVYADVDATRLLMDPASLAETISPSTRAAVVTHLYGGMAPMREITSIVKDVGIALIEDCAQAHGAVIDGRKAGSWGTAAAFSFYPTKNLGALGDAGAVVTDDDELAGRVEALAHYGWSDKYFAKVPEGRNSRLDEMQAAVLRRKLPGLDARNARRREILGRYADAATGTPLRFVHAGDSTSVAHLAVAVHPDRDALADRMRARGVSTSIHYPLLDTQQLALADHPGASKRLPVSEEAVTRIITLPCFPQMTDDEVSYVCECIATCEVD